MQTPSFLTSILQSYSFALPSTLCTLSFSSERKWSFQTCYEKKIHLASPTTVILWIVSKSAYATRFTLQISHLWHCHDVTISHPVRHMGWSCKSGRDRPHVDFTVCRLQPLLFLLIWKGITERTIVIWHHYPSAQCVFRFCQFFWTPIGHTARVSHSISIAKNYSQIYIFSSTMGFLRHRAMTPV